MSSESVQIDGVAVICKGRGTVLVSQGWPVDFAASSWLPLEHIELAVQVPQPEGWPRDKAPEAMRITMPRSLYNQLHCRLEITE